MEKTKKTTREEALAEVRRMLTCYRCEVCEGDFADVMIVVHDFTQFFDIAGRMSSAMVQALSLDVAGSECGRATIRFDYPKGWKVEKRKKRNQLKKGNHDDD